MDVHESDRASKNLKTPSNPAESNDETSRHLHGRSKSPARAVSAEKRRLATLPSPWGLPTAAVHGMGAVARKVVVNRFTESLWRRSSSSDTSSAPNSKRENLSNEPLSDRTSKPSVNVADEETAKLPVSSKLATDKEKTLLKRKNVFDQSENSKPIDGSHVRQINQHPRPSTTGSNVIDQSEDMKTPDGSPVSTTSSDAIDQSENLKTPDGSPGRTTGSDVIDQSKNSKPLDDSHVRLFNQHRWPSTTGSNVIGESENSKPPDGSHGSNVIDQLENLKPSDDSHVRLFNQHRWPGTTGSNVIDKSLNSTDGSHVKPVNQHWRPSKTGSNVTDQSEKSKPPDGSHVKLVNQHRWPGSVGSNVLNKNVNPPNEATKMTPDTGVRTPNLRKMPLPNYASKPIQESSSDAMNLSSSSSSLVSGKSKIDKSERISASSADDGRLEFDKLQKISNLVPSSSHRTPSVIPALSRSLPTNESQPSSPKKSYGSPSRGVSPSHTRDSTPAPSPAREVSPSLTITGVNPSPASRGASLAPSKGVSHSPIVRGVSLTPATREVSLTPVSRRGVSLTPATRKVNPSPTAREVDPSLTSREVDLSLATREVSLTPASIGISLTPATRKVIPSPTTREVDPSLTSREVDLSLATREVGPSLITGGVSPLPTTRRVGPSPGTREVGLAPTVRGTSPMPPERGVSPIPTAKSLSPPPDHHIPKRPSSPRQSCNSNTVSNSTEIGPSPSKEISLTHTRGVSPPPLRGISHSLATRGVSPTPVVRGVSPSPSGRATIPSHTARGVSPTSTRPSSPRQSCDLNTASISTEHAPSPARGVSPPPRVVGPRARCVSPTPKKPSGSRHYFSSNILSMFTSSRKAKKADYKEAARYLQLLHNIQVQWQFVNASAEAALDLQRVNAEESLFDVWRTTLELQESIAAKKIDIDLLILQLKLYAILYRQMAYIDEWASIQRVHESALSITTKDLEARSLQLPVTEGVKADIKALKSVVFSTVQVMETTVPSIQSTLSKLDGTHVMASELANIASHERALLDECEIFLASAAPLHIEECCLRSHLIQVKPRLQE